VPAPATTPPITGNKLCPCPSPAGTLNPRACPFPPGSKRRQRYSFSLGRSRGFGLGRQGRHQDDGVGALLRWASSVVPSSSADRLERIETPLRLIEMETDEQIQREDAADEHGGGVQGRVMRSRGEVGELEESGGEGSGRARGTRTSSPAVRSRGLALLPIARPHGGPGERRRPLVLFAWLISHQPTVFFSQNKPATSKHQKYFSLTINQHQPSAKRTDR
jgi:hypothetical protein